ncbi:MAG: hypothetical protein J0I07_37645 [Myxococcales bacterium]|nr:hypothetical protein [Myxococcales bacterium]
MKLVKLSFLVAAALAAQACGADGSPGVDGKDGKDGKPGEAQASDENGALGLVTPTKGILDRELEVSIGGSGTKFADGAKPSFGPGIEVLEVTTSTASLITAKIRISKDAQIGPRTLTVGDLEAKNAFTVIPAINVLAEGGKAEIEQGGLLQFAIENNDSRAFDPENFQLDAGELIDLGSQASGPQSAVGFVLAAPLTKAGSSQVSVSNLDASGKPRVSFLSANDALTVKARAADPFKLGTPTDAAFATPTETKLFKLTSPASEAAIVDYRIEVAAGGTARPLAFVFGTGGGKDDRVGQVLPGQNSLPGQFNPPPYDLRVALPIPAGAAATDHYVVLADLSGKAGATAKVTATRSAASVANESGAAHGANAPQLVGSVNSSAGQVLNANLASADEVDAYSFTVEADAKLQLSAVSDADLEIVLTKDPTVIEDPQGTAPANRKVLGYLYPGKQFAAQRTLTAGVGATTVYAVVMSDSQGTVKTGKYTLGMRKVP